MKTCFRCGETKPLADFYPHPMMADGHLGKCKTCARADSRANRQDRADYYRDYDRKRKKRAETLFAGLPNFREDQEHLKQGARQRAKEAVREGRLSKGPCEVCGDESDVEAHHDDYSRPLAVRWLCPRHHKQLHFFWIHVRHLVSLSS